MRGQALSYDSFSLGSRILSVLGSRRMRRYYRNIAIISFGIFLLLTLPVSLLIACLGFGVARCRLVDEDAVSNGIASGFAFVRRGQL